MQLSLSKMLEDVFQMLFIFMVMMLVVVLDQPDSGPDAAVPQ